MPGTLAFLDNDTFRARAVAFVRAVAAGAPAVPCTLPLTAPQPLWVTVSFYFEGAVLGRGTAVDPVLCTALEAATRRAVDAAGPKRGLLPQARCVVELTNRRYALVEYQGKGLELVHGLVPVRRLDRALLQTCVDAGAAYLLRVLDSAHGGAHKFYDAPRDRLEAKLYPLYTASTAYTLLALYAQSGDPGLRAPIHRAVEFVLSMQRIAPGQPDHGAFHYALDLARLECEPRFVVGTAAKSIFTLLRLYALTGAARDLHVARTAADWLLTMQRPDGAVHAELRQQPDGTWTVIDKESILYTGQVLSALSRIYRATGDSPYLAAAARIAARLRAAIDREGPYLGDDFRPPNPISSSWAILSLRDFAHAAQDPELRAFVDACADDLLARQIRDPADVDRHGRWPASLSSSGTGWLAEVFSELYLDTPHHEQDRRDRLRDAIVLLLRQLAQHTYFPENSFVVKDPARAHGGLFWTARDRYVRTDAVCHAMNAHLAMLGQLPDGLLASLPEPPLTERLGLPDRSRRPPAELHLLIREPHASDDPEDEIIA